MTVREMCEFGMCIGLETLEEAYAYVKLHWSSLFTVDNMDKEIKELTDELTSGYCGQERIVEVLDDFGSNVKVIKVADVLPMFDLLVNQSADSATRGKVMSMVRQAVESKAFRMKVKG